MTAIEFNDAFGANAEHVKRLALRSADAALYYQGQPPQTVEALQKQNARQQIEDPVIMIVPPKHSKMDVFSTQFQLDGRNKEPETAFKNVFWGVEVEWVAKEGIVGGTNRHTIAAEDTDITKSRYENWRHSHHNAL